MPLGFSVDLLSIRLDKDIFCIYNVNMNAMSFEWDDRKCRANRAKHGVSFEEAQTVFMDENALLIHDPDHSESEDRFVLLGFSAKLRMLIVCHAYRKNDQAIRIISARKALPTERKHYQERCRS
jgi:uncharacterized protein